MSRGKGGVEQITRYSTLAANSARRRTTLSFPPSRRGRILLSTTVAAEVVNATAPAEASAEAPAPPSRRETRYDALGLRRDATDAQIRSSSYRTMSKTCHPDVDPSEASRAKFDAINEAYATLKTAKTRDAYDYELRKEDLAEVGGALAAERSEKAPVDREAAADVAKLTRSDLRRILLRRGMDASGPRSELAKRVRKLDLSE
ncbi:DnaJ-like protein [Aureococcus anophagefferens]|uniref:DnaJ-like protein n=1 Tax=Aureococcus anophagefferens TaxID=44056 RepID=A0ABR1FK48_AURAN